MDFYCTNLIICHNYFDYNRNESNDGRGGSSYDSEPCALFGRLCVPSADMCL